LDLKEKNMNSFSDRRLEVARLLAKQRGLTWTGLEMEERDRLMDAAHSAVQITDRVFAPRPCAVSGVDEADMAPGHVSRLG
jgi:hypothetical protein